MGDQLLGVTSSFSSRLWARISAHNKMTIETYRALNPRGFRDEWDTKPRAGQQFDTPERIADEAKLYRVRFAQQK